MRCTTPIARGGAGAGVSRCLQWVEAVANGPYHHPAPQPLRRLRTEGAGVAPGVVGLHDFVQGNGQVFLRDHA